jgi:hypothetical protein
VHAWDEYDGYQGPDTGSVCPQCGRPEVFCDAGEHQSDADLAASLGR